MSYSQTDLDQFRMINILSDSIAALQYKDRQHDSSLNAIFTRVDTYKRQYDADKLNLEGRLANLEGRIKDVWSNISRIDSDIATLNSWVSEINTRLSGQVTQIGQNSGGFLSGLGQGLGVSTPLLLAGGAALLLLTRR